MYVYYIKTVICSILYAMFLVEHNLCSIHTIVWQCALPLPSLARDGHLFFILPKKSHLSLSRPIGITAIPSLSSTTDQRKSPLSLSLSSYWHSNTIIIIHNQPKKVSSLSLSSYWHSNTIIIIHNRPKKSHLSLSHPIGTAILSLSSTTDNSLCSIAALPSRGIHPEGPC